MFASGEQVLGKDMEERERQSVKLIAQLQSVTEKYNTTERQRDSLETTVDDVSRLVILTHAQIASISDHRDDVTVVCRGEQVRVVTLF